MEELIVRRLHTALPSLRAVYLFGSVVTEHFTEDSDIDVAVLTSEPMDALLRWKLIQQLAIALNRDVDLVDLFDSFYGDAVSGGEHRRANIYNRCFRNGVVGTEDISVVPNPQRRPETYSRSYSTDRTNLWRLTCSPTRPLL